MTSRSRTAAITIAIAVVSAAVSGCTFTFPRDLSAVSISKVSRADVTRMLGADAELPFFRNEEEFIVVRVSTRKDVISHALKRHSTLGANGWLCDDGREIQTSPTLYVPGRGAFTPIEHDAWLTKPMEPTAAGSYEYDTFHSLQRRAQVAEFATYDLRRAPQDICLQIGGWYWFVFQSNVVRISAKEIEAAIRQ
jgi:hypothetical protein